MRADNRRSVEYAPLRPGRPRRDAARGWVLGLRATRSRSAPAAADPVATLRQLLSDAPPPSEGCLAAMGRLDELPLEEAESKVDAAVEGTLRGCETAAEYVLAMRAFPGAWL